MAKAPTPGKTKEPKGLTFGFGGRKWRFLATEIRPRDVADLRRETGFGARDAWNEFVEKDSVDLDYAAALIFLARRQSESPAISFEAATAGFGYSTPFEVGLVEDEDDSPEA